MNILKTQSFSRTAAEILAAALFETYPDVELWGPEELSYGFGYQFYFPHPIPPDFTSQIEEKMRQIVKERRPINVLEMVPISARGLLLKEGHKRRAQSLSQGKELVEVIQCGSFHDLSPGPHLKNTAELHAFKILHVEVLEERGLWIEVSAFGSKEELKSFLKKWASYSKKRHEKIGERGGLWKMWEEEILWLPPGLEIREKLQLFFKRNLFKGALEVEPPFGMSLKEVCAELGGKVAAVGVPGPLEEGLFQGGRELSIAISFEKNRDDAISSLQTIGKTLNMLGFSYRIHFKAAQRSQVMEPLASEQEWKREIDACRKKTLQVDFLVEDGLSRPRVAAQVEWDKEEKVALTTVFLERNLALLLENRDFSSGGVEAIKPGLEASIENQ